MFEKGEFMKFNLCLKTCRTAKGLSISALAKASGVSASYLRTLEKGTYPETRKKVRPSIEILEKIGKALCSSPQGFYDKIDWEDLTYLGIKENRSSILAEAERTLSTQRKQLLEQIALTFMEAEVAIDPFNVDAYPVLEEMGISGKSINSLDAEYSQSLNVFTDVSYPQQADKQTPHFGTGCCIFDGKVLIRTFAGRFASPLGAKIGEAYAAWLGLLIGNSL